MRRFGLFIACAAAGLMSLPGSAAAQSGGKGGIQDLATLAEMTDLIKDARGKSPVFVFVYSAARAQDVFIEVNKLAKEFRNRGLHVLAFSTDADTKELEDLLVEVKLNLDPYRVQSA